MAKSKYIFVDAELQYAKVFLENRDMGNDKVDHSDTDGVYSVRLTITSETKDQMIAAGIPEKQGAFPTFKPEGAMWSYQAKRPHKHKYFKAYDEAGQVTDEPLIMGPPKVFDKNAALAAWEASENKGNWADFITPWKIEDGLIGNGTKATVKLKIDQAVNNKGKPFTKVQLESIAINELVVFENAGDWF